jgi:hypothetical protein
MPDLESRVMATKGWAAVHFLAQPIGGFMCFRFSATLITGIALAASSLNYAQTQPKATPATPPRTAKVPQRYRPVQQSASALQYYSMIWGVDSLSVKSGESGEIIRFSYRIVDAEKANALNDKKNEPSLIDPAAGVKLIVPSFEKVGKLRQSSTPEAGKVYWMGFSNKGGYVRPGHRVNVAIGAFRADGLIVQ